MISDGSASNGGKSAVSISIAKEAEDLPNCIEVMSKSSEQDMVAATRK